MMTSLMAREIAILVSSFVKCFAFEKNQKTNLFSLQLLWTESKLERWTWITFALVVMSRSWVRAQNIPSSSEVFAIKNARCDFINLYSTIFLFIKF